MEGTLLKSIQGIILEHGAMFAIPHLQAMLLFAEKGDHDPDGSAFAIYSIGEESHRSIRQLLSAFYLDGSDPPALCVSK